MGFRVYFEVKEIFFLSYKKLKEYLELKEDYFGFLRIGINRLFEDFFIVFYRIVICIWRSNYWWLEIFFKGGRKRIEIKDDW